MPFAFSGPCRTEQALDIDPSGRTKRVIQGFTFTGPYGLRIEVPAGMLTDFASTPKALWPIYPPDGPWEQAAVVHDLLYTEGQVAQPVADSLFFEGMGILPVPAHRRWIFYLVLRAVGFLAWNAHRREDRKKARQRKRDGAY